MGMVDFLIAPRMQRVLAAVLLRPERDHSYNELINIAGVGRNGGRDTIERLAEAGVVTERRFSNQRRFQANTEYPLFAELRAICVKSFGVVDKLKEALEPLAHDIQLAFVFGSVAEGRERASSDIDLMVVGDVDSMALSRVVANVEADLKRSIHLSSYDSEEWTLLLQEDKVIKKIAGGPKLMVIGNVGDSTSH